MPRSVPYEKNYYEDGKNDPGGVQDANDIS